MLPILIIFGGMKPFCFLVVASVLAFSQGVRAQEASADDEYYDVYTLIRQGDALADKGKTAQAQVKYSAAQAALKKVKDDYPLWNQKVVQYRQGYLAMKLTALPAPAAPASASGGNGAAGDEMLPAANPDEPVAFKLKWQVGKRYVRKSEQSLQVEGVSSQSKPLTQSVQQRNDQTVSVLKARDGGGVELEMQEGGYKMLDSAGTWRDVQMGAGIHAKYLTDADGKIVSVEDLPDTLTELEKAVPGRAEELKKSLTESALKYEASMFEELLGKPVKIGETWTSRVDLPSLTTNTSPMQGVEVNCKFTGWAMHDKQKCAVIEFSVAASNLATGSDSKATEKDSGKVWFDPEQGMVVEMTLKREVSLTGNMPGGAATAGVPRHLVTVVTKKLAEVSDLAK